jgi:hypothetical protein
MFMILGTIFLFSCEAVLFEKVKDKVTCMFYRTSYLKILYG